MVERQQKVPQQVEHGRTSRKSIGKIVEHEALVHNPTDKLVEEKIDTTKKSVSTKNAGQKLQHCGSTYVSTRHPRPAMKLIQILRKRAGAECNRAEHRRY
jgi:hypothetical protein